MGSKMDYCVEHEEYIKYIKYIKFGGEYGDGR